MNDRQRQLDVATGIANRAEDLHPWVVAVVACNWDERADFDAFLVGLLHDSLEDGYATEAELRDLPLLVVGAVQVLTRKDGERYRDYIEGVRSFGAHAPVPGLDACVGDLARKVKIADATVNLDRCLRGDGWGSLEERYRWVIEELS
jgi:hypothetical protein